MAHASAVELLPLAHGVEDTKGAEGEDDNGGKVGEPRLPLGEVGEAKAELEKGVKEAVGAGAGGEKVVFGKAGGEGAEVEEFDHGEDDEEQAHEVVHPDMPRPGGV